MPWKQRQSLLDRAFSDELKKLNVINQRMGIDDL
jgi:hypothetical protein